MGLGTNGESLTYGDAKLGGWRIDIYDNRKRMHCKKVEEEQKGTARTSALQLVA